MTKQSLQTSLDIDSTTDCLCVSDLTLFNIPSKCSFHTFEMDCGSVALSTVVANGMDLLYRRLFN